MSAITKYFQVTNQIMASYTYDKGAIYYSSSNSDSAKPISYYLPVLYRAKNNTVCMMTTRFEKDSINQTNNIFFTKFEDDTCSTQTYLGYKKSENISSSQSSPNSIKSITKRYLEALKNKGFIKDIIDPGSSGSIFFGDSVSGGSSWQLPFDKLKVYFIAGYTMNDMSAFCVKVNADSSSPLLSSKTKNSNYATIANLIITKETLKNNVHWLANPIYMNSKFYDRYVEIDIPSVYALAKGYEDLNNKNSYFYNGESTVDNELATFLRTLAIKSTSVVTLKFSNVLDEEISQVENSEILETRDKTLIGTCQFTLHSTEDGYLKLESNSDFFNVRIFEDKDTNAIVYYPIFGTGNSYSDLNLDIMYNIESGRIPMEDLSTRDANMTGEDFIDAYGEGALKWTILNEVNTQYNYIKINVATNETISNATKSFVESKTSFIDYGGMTSTDGDFWRTYYKPMPPHFYGYVCDSIVVTVICHLYNRMTGCDITRTASLIVSNASAKYSASPKMIDVANISKWKIVNKKESLEAAAVSPTVNTTSSKEYIRSYYDSTNILLKEPGTDNTYSQGEATLKLYHETHNYQFKLYNMNSSNAQVPYVMTGNYNYCLVMPAVDGNKIKIYPIMDSKSTNLSLGILMFRISETEAASVMSLSENDRYFAIVCEGSKTTGSENSTLYEGKVDYYVK